MRETTNEYFLMGCETTSKEYILVLILSLLLQHYMGKYSRRCMLKIKPTGKKPKNFLSDHRLLRHERIISIARVTKTKPT